MTLRTIAATAIAALLALGATAQADTTTTPVREALGNEPSVLFDVTIPVDPVVVPPVGVPFIPVLGPAGPFEVEAWDGSEPVPVFPGAGPLGEVVVARDGQRVCLTVTAVGETLHDGCANLGIAAGLVPEAVQPLGPVPPVTVPETPPVVVPVPGHGPVDVPHIPVYPGTSTSAYELRIVGTYEYDCSKFTRMYHGDVGPAHAEAYSPFNPLDPGHLQWWANGDGAQLVVGAILYQDGVPVWSDGELHMFGYGQIVGFAAWQAGEADC